MFETKDGVPSGITPATPEQPAGIMSIRKTAVFVVLIVFCVILFQQIFMRPLIGVLRSSLMGVFGCIIPVEHMNYFECVAGVTKLGIEQTVQENRFKGFEGFVSEKTPYSSIKNMVAINNKLAYTFERKDGTSGVVFDGKEISSAYQEVYSSTPLIVTEDEPAYIAIKNGTKNKTVIVWHGQEYAANYVEISIPIVSNGILAYRAFEQASDGKFHHVLVIGDTKVATRFGTIIEYSIYGEHLSYTAKDTERKSYVVIDGKEYGPYDSARDLRRYADFSVISVERGTEKLYIFDGKEFSRSTQQTHTAVVQNKLAYFDANSDLMLGDIKYASAEDVASDWIFSVNNTLAYFRKTADGALQLMIDNKTFGEPIRGTILDVIVSPNGKIALNLEKEKTRIGIVFASDGTILQNLTNPFWRSFNGDIWVADLASVPDGVRIPYSITSKALVNGKIYFAARESRIDEMHPDKSIYIFKQQ